MTRGNQTGTPGGSPFMSLKSTVTSENTKTNQAIIDPRKARRIIALVLSTVKLILVTNAGEIA